MNNHQPKISIILPSYNGAEYISKSIESVLMQDFNDFELIVIDDCSTDGTFEIAKNFALKDERVKVFSNEKNLKLPATLNKGFNMANGAYLTWISDDNLFKQGALSFMFNYLQDNPKVDLISCAMDKIIEGTGEFQKKTDFDKTRTSAGFLAAYCNVGGCFLFKKEVFQKIGGYDTSFFCGEDYDFWCKVALEFEIAYSSKNFFTYTIRKGAMSNTHKKQLDDITAEIHKKYAQKILQKYPLKPADTADVYYQIYKTNNDFEILKAAFRANFLRSLLKFSLFFIRQIGK